MDVLLLDEPALRCVCRRDMRDADVAVIEGMMGLFDGTGAHACVSLRFVSRYRDRE
jgi:cobyrinic acid a,c-diamide synthase